MSIAYAYLVMSFKVLKGIPRFQGIGIYSESAITLTRFQAMEYLDYMQMSGKDYDDAQKKLREYIFSQPNLKWMHPFLDPYNHKTEMEHLLQIIKRI